MTDEQNEFGGDNPTLQEIKEMRRENPSGWLELSMYESRALLVDAILDTPTDYEFTHSDIAHRAGITNESVRNHIDILVGVGLVDPVEIDGQRYYTVSSRSKVLIELEQLNDVVNAIRAGEPVRYGEEELETEFSSTAPSSRLSSQHDQFPLDTDEFTSEADDDAPGIDDLENLRTQPPRQSMTTAGF